MIWDKVKEQLGTCWEQLRKNKNPTPSPAPKGKEKKRTYVPLGALAYFLKSTLRQKKKYENSNISPFKNIVFQKIL